MASNPLPVGLKYALLDAVITLHLDWDRTNPEPPLIALNGKARSIREICDLVLSHDASEQAPDELKEELVGQMQKPQYGALRASFDGSYASAARCLLQLMDDRIKDREQLDELRRDRS
jgi:hypothetical protein